LAEVLTCGAKEECSGKIRRVTVNMKKEDGGRRRKRKRKRRLYTWCNRAKHCWVRAK
jgi:hypothetical protein